MIVNYLPSVDKLPRKRKRYGAVLEAIELLLHSSCQACEIDISPYKDSGAAHACYYNATKRHGVSDKVQVTVCSGRLFLVKKEVSENA